MHQVIMVTLHSVLINHITCKLRNKRKTVIHKTSDFLFYKSDSNTGHVEYS